MMLSPLRPGSAAKAFAALVALAVSAPTGSAAAAKFAMPRLLGKLEVSKPAFLSLEETGSSGGKSLIVSSFNPFGGDRITVVEDVGSHMANPGGATFVDMGAVRWPNETRMVPGEMLSGGADGELLAVAGGFLVPGKSTGAITLVGMASKRQFKITHDKKGWFYHRVEFVDMNGDGRLDVLTARATKPIIGASKGELVWLEHPADDALAGAWKEHVLAEGPDVHFRLADLDGDGSAEIVATEFFSKRLSLWWREGGRWEGRIIDDALGSAFDVQVVDLNRDGNFDLLVTNHEADAAAAVFAYVVPKDLRGGPFERHTLLQGIETRQGGIRQASPGAAVAFQPYSKVSAGKPFILVNGDGSQRAHLLVPRSQDKGDWSYEERILLDAKATVGMSAVGDVDGDGWTEIFVPAYDKNEIHTFTFKP